MIRLAWRARPLRPSALLRTARSVSSAAPPLIHIQNGTFYKTYPTPDDAATGKNPPIFSDFNFTLSSRGTPNPDGVVIPQTWALIGNAERTQILDILRGQYICTPPTARSYPYLLTDEIAEKDPRLRTPANAIQYIGFSGEGSGAIGGTRGAYLSARYESLREETDWTVRQYLTGQTSLNPLEEDQAGTLRDHQMLKQIITDLRLEELLDMPVANLSNGQTRRTRIAKALLNKPEVLLLDDPFMGLDPAAVRHISSILEHMALRSSPRVIFSFRPQDPIPDWITHIMVLGNHNRILLQAPKEEAKRVFEIWRRRAEYEKPLSRADEWTRRTDQETQKQLKGGYLTRQMLRDMRISHQKPRVNNQYEPPVYRASGGEPIIEMDGVRVQYGDKCVLGHWRQNVSGEAKEGLHWTVRRGQRWAILGANGSGKTTLISLITSDHPQTYALPIRLFGRSRLPEAGQPGLSIFELQSRIGHSSPEIHAFFPRQLTIRQAIESAFSDTFLTRPRLTHEQDLDVNAFLRFFAPELNPDGHHGPPTKVTMPDNQLFPPLVKETLKTDFYNPDDGVEYADTIIFGDLSTALQRLVLLLRALVSRPDIVILDEALSGMPASLRDKCLTFIDQGEWCVKHRVHIQTADNARFRGLSDNQALLTIAHSNEDIPSSVRYFMRLPSGSERKEKLDFRFGVLKPESQWDNLRVWNRNWSLLYWKKDRERVEKNFFDADMPVRDDAEKYEWWHI